ncbi:MAG: 5'-nucleotidase, lipoprotein e(P4) family [Porphyromonas sp.]|nr:5'-nucleotidase, lipoprotein e(P4) family [Porphyromonas sp.]
MKKLLLSLPFILLLSACGTGSRSVSPEMPFAKIYTAVWMQRAAEYDALCFQAFNSAKLSLDQAIMMRQESDSKPLAIITDIDETVLDNSPNAVHQGLKGELFDSAEWTRWCNRVEADTVPGAPSFLKYAADEGVEIFYISNRKEAERESTLANLRKFDLPNADNDHLLLKTGTSNKDERRAKVMETYDVVMYIGDQLTDFPEHNVAQERERDIVTRRDIPKFGAVYIILPNPNYGEWESALFERQHYDKYKQAEIIKEAARTY